MNNETPTCPHCHEPLLRWEPSPYTGWGHDLFYCDTPGCRSIGPQTWFLPFCLDLYKYLSA